MASTDRKARKARNRQRRADTHAEKMRRAFVEAGIPMHRGNADSAAPAQPDSRRYYRGRPAYLDPQMKAGEPPAPWTVERYDDGTSERHPTNDEAKARFWLLNADDFQRLTTARPVTPAEPSSTPTGIAPQLLEVTGLGRGARPAFVRAPNKALTLYRTKNLITHPQYEAGMRLWLDFEEASIPPAIVPEMGRIMVDGGKLPDWPLPNIDADRRLRRAIAALPDATDRAMIIHVCLYGSALATGCFPGCKDKNAKMPRFRKALDQLRRYYEDTTKD